MDGCIIFLLFICLFLEATSTESLLEDAREYGQLIGTHALHCLWPLCSLFRDFIGFQFLKQLITSVQVSSSVFLQPILRALYCRKPNESVLLLGDNKDVDWSCGSNIFECIDQLVFINFGWRNFFADNLVENCLLVCHEDKIAINKLDYKYLLESNW